MSTKVHASHLGPQLPCVEDTEISSMRPSCAIAPNSSGRRGTSLKCRPCRCKINSPGINVSGHGVRGPEADHRRVRADSRDVRAMIMHPRTSESLSLPCVVLHRSALCVPPCRKPCRRNGPSGCRLGVIGDRTHFIDLNLEDRRDATRRSGPWPILKSGHLAITRNRRSRRVSSTRRGDRTYLEWLIWKGSDGDRKSPPFIADA